MKNHTETAVNPTELDKTSSYIFHHLSGYGYHPLWYLLPGFNIADIVVTGSETTAETLNWGENDGGVVAYNPPALSELGGPLATLFDGAPAAVSLDGMDATTKANTI
jgi:hypothetical protein